MTSFDELVALLRRVPAQEGRGDPAHPLGADAPRSRLVTTALWLVSLSVAFGLLAGSISVAGGLATSSLGVLGAGLSVLADVTGSAILIWRFRAERRDPVSAARVEARAALVVAAALAVISIVLTAEAVHALATGSRPGSSAMAQIPAGVTLAVLTPLAAAKRRAGNLLASPALSGDGTLSAIGAATSGLALTGLLLYRALGWWQADRVAALAVAALAAVAAYRTGRSGA